VILPALNPAGTLPHSRERVLANILPGLDPISGIDFWHFVALALPNGELANSHSQICL